MEENKSGYFSSNNSPKVNISSLPLVTHLSNNSRHDDGSGGVKKLMEKSQRQSEEERLLTQVTNVMSKHDIDEEEIARILLTKNSGGGPEGML